MFSLAALQQGILLSDGVMYTGKMGIIKFCAIEIWFLFLWQGERV